MAEEETKQKGAILTLVIEERLRFGKLYPPRGSYLDNIIREDIEGKIRLSQTEIEKFDFREDQEKEMFLWGDNVDTSTPIEFTGTEMSWLKKRVDALDDNKEIPPEIFSICRKIREAT